MITTIDKYNSCLKDVQEEFRDTVNGIPAENQKRKPRCNQVFDLGKPVYMLIDNEFPEEMPTLIDKGDHWEHRFHLCGVMPVEHKYTNDFGWVNDSESVFFIERPFTNKVVRLLRELLPEHEVKPLKNDIIIDGWKVGPTCETGRTDYTGLNSPQNSGIIYVLRWTNPEGLDKYFGGDPHHELRKTSLKQPIGSLDMFLPKKMTRADFIAKLEAMK